MAEVTKNRECTLKVFKGGQKVAVYDTQVVKKNGVIMHFDIIVSKDHIRGKVPKVEHLKEKSRCNWLEIKARRY